VAAAYEAQQVAQKLSHIRRPDVVLQAKFMNPLAQVNPKIAFIENVKLFPGASKQVEAVIVKCCGMNLFAEKRTHAVAHLPGSGNGVSKREHFFRLGMPLLYKVSYAMDQNRCFSGSGSRHHQHWSMNMLDRLALAIVGNKRRRLNF
jgi:hypothetical protein